MKLKMIKLLALFGMFFAFTTVQAQDITTINASDESIGENLDLEAVATAFGDSKDLTDFETKLNDPEKKLSNLDLNEDNYVDYLRVVEMTEEGTHLIAIQAVLGEDIYQDVATIEVEKDANNETRVQVVGDVYLYGQNYIIEPVYVYRPLIFSIFWRPFYRPYRSLYYWGYYPRYYRYWNPFRVRTYRRNVHVHINVRHSFNRVHVRRSRVAVNLHAKSRRNDYGKRYPGKSYDARVAGINKANGTKKRAAGISKTDGTKKRIAGVNQADGDKYRSAGVRKADGTKKRVAGVNKADGTKKRSAGVSRANGDQMRAKAVKNPDGTQKRVARVNKSNGTKKRYTSNGAGKKNRAYGARSKKGFQKGKKGQNRAKGRANSGKKKKRKRN